MAPLLHRHLLEPPQPPPSDYKYSRDFVFAAIFCTIAGYVVLVSIHHWILLCFRRRQQQQQSSVEREFRIGSSGLFAIPIIVYGSSSSSVEVSCPICLADYEVGEEVRVLPKCRHMFHRECIDRWLVTRSLLCPICRRSVIEKSVPPTETRCGDDGSARRQPEEEVRV